MKKASLTILVCIAFAATSFAKVYEDSTELMLKQIYALQDSVAKAMKYEKGTIILPADIVRLNIPEGFKYLGVEQSKYIIEKMWGNPPQENLQGMLFPENSDPFSDSSYGYIVTYSPVGYVKDDDAKDIDYDDLMKNMKKDDVEENNKRKEMGLSTLHTVGWAAKPFYDEKKKVLHWALDLRSDGVEEHTLNYKVISLGRKGMLTMNAIGSVNQLDMIRADVDQVLTMAEYTEGNKYSDFDSNIDEVAAWTVGGLVAGKVLLKVGFFAKFWKLILLGGGALIAGIARFFKKKKQNESMAYEPVQTPLSEPKA
jgi:uncharacterized membrane-anchored protein